MTRKQTLDELREKREKLTAEGFRLRDKIHDLQQQVDKLCSQIRREETRQLIGKPVRCNFYHGATNPLAWMNTAVGTLVEVRTTKCVVNYPEHGRWRFYLDDIEPVAEQAELVEQSQQ